MKLLAIGSVFVFLGVGSAHASLLVNGSFEVPDVGVTGIVSISPGTEPAGFGWTVEAGDVEVFGELHPGLPGPSFDGQQHLDLNGVSVGALSHAFATTTGVEYRFSFAYASNYTHHGIANPAEATVRVVDVGSGADLAAPVAISHGSSSESDLDWVLHVLEFTADGPVASISFSSDSVATPFGGILLDGVTVAVVPDPLCSADLDGPCAVPDGAVDVTDLLVLLGAWGACGGCAADFDGSGVVDVADLLTLLAQWGSC